METLTSHETAPAFSLFLALTIGAATAQKPTAIVVHGGAGKVDRAWLTADREREHREKLEEAVEAGTRILESGGGCLDAVEAAIVVLEDSPLFNAGKGAVFTLAKTNELDASIMDGATAEAGAVGGVTRIKNPIRAARAVMEKSPHVMLAGDGADEFAESAGLEMVDPGYFKTRRRMEQLEKISEKKQASDETGPRRGEAAGTGYLGTVGAVALDREGNIAAGTSTGGLTGKRYGRIGDSPIIGAGTYARNGVGGISCTGHGEFFIRYAVAHDIAARAEYKKISLEDAAEEVINTVLVNAGGRGGMIGLDPSGTVVMKMNTESMWRSWRDAQDHRGTALLREEKP